MKTTKKELIEKTLDEPIVYKTSNNLYIKAYYFTVQNKVYFNVSNGLEEHFLSYKTINDSKLNVGGEFIDEDNQ
jgi:hypothetical protein